MGLSRCPSRGEKGVDRTFKAAAPVDPQSSQLPIPGADAAPHVLDPKLPRGCTPS